MVMTEDALRAVANTSPNQTWFFVCDSYRKNARVVEAHIAKTLASAAARRIGGCVRVGHVQGDKAVTL